MLRQQTSDSLHFTRLVVKRHPDPAGSCLQQTEETSERPAPLSQPLCASLVVVVGVITSFSLPPSPPPPTSTFIPPPPPPSSSPGRRQESGENKMALPKVFAPGKHTHPAPPLHSPSTCVCILRSAPLIVSPSFNSTSLLTKSKRFCLQL